MTDVPVVPTSAISAKNFRAILHALSRPGHVHVISATVNPPKPLLSVAAVVAMTLCDYQSPMWLSPALDIKEVGNFLRFQTGAPIVADPSLSAFAFITMSEACDSITGFALGSHEYPDRSTTLVIQCDDFDTGAAIELSGPGLQTTHTITVSDTNENFWRNVQANNRSFPLGYDFLFVTSNQVLGLPRSTRITIPGDL